MKNLMKKMVAVATAATMMMAMSLTASAATASTTQSVSTTLYKTGTTNLSMGNDAFAEGGTLTYNYDEDGNVTSTDVSIDVSSVTYLGIITGYLTSLEIEDVALTGTDLDNDNNIDVFTGTVDEKIELDTVYEVSVNISVAGFMNKNTNGDLVFTAK